MLGEKDSRWSWGPRLGRWSSGRPACYWLAVGCTAQNCAGFPKPENKIRDGSEGQVQNLAWHDQPVPVSRSEEQWAPVTIVWPPKRAPRRSAGVFFSCAACTWRLSFFGPLTISSISDQFNQISETFERLGGCGLQRSFRNGGVSEHLGKDTSPFLEIEPRTYCWIPALRWWCWWL